MALSYIFIVLATSSIYILRLVLNRRRNLLLPPGTQSLPGPAGYPFIGSVLDLPTQNSFLKFHEWGQQYGAIYQVNLAGTNHVWISQDNIASELLSKRSHIYSDRPFIPALEQDNRISMQYLPLMSKNEIWLRQRKFAKQVMDTCSKVSFYHYPELESIRLLKELMSNTARYNHSLESFIARVTCRLAWGTSTPSGELKQRARELLLGVSPTGSIANKLPFVMKLPKTLSSARAWESRRSRTERRFFEVMQDRVRTQIEGGTKTPRSWMRQFLEQRADWRFSSDLEGAYAVGMHGIAGALTIAAPMQSFCLAMCHYPEFQPLLHEEIDRVCGDRMPTFSDMPQMPVLRAFIRETMRWRPPVPTGIPHESTRDDVYNDYFIPAGSVIHPFEWSISRDPVTFPDPDEFNPLRWLNETYPTYREPLSQFPTITSYSQFGYGRRVCQGMAVTEADLFVGIGSMAWLFSFSRGDIADEKIRVPKPDGTAQHTAVIDDVEKDVNPDVITLSQESLAAQLLTPPPENDHQIAYFDRQSTKIQTGPYGLAIPPSDIEDQLDYINNQSSIPFNDPFGPATPPSEETITAVLGTTTLSQHLKSTAASQSSKLRQYSNGAVVGASATRAQVSSPDVESAHEQSRGLHPSTLNYSPLLIAKPLPFDLKLSVRSQRRADFVARRFDDLKVQGEFEDEECFWEGGHKGTREFGWGKV